MLSNIKPFVQPSVKIKESDGYFETPIEKLSESLCANAYYFSQYEWAAEYLMNRHRDKAFIERWMAVIGDWTGKIVIDIGCGPGNIFASLKGNPKLIIGVDVASTALKMAGKLGYVPVFADASNLPFKSCIADVVMLNATLHHCDDMERVLKEAARLVKPGGMLITDHDPQLSAFDFKGLTKFLWNSRSTLYKITGYGFHRANDRKYWHLACEAHRKPGHGVTQKMFKRILEPLGFKVNVFPHNHHIGAEVLLGQQGKAEFKYYLGNILSGRKPNTRESALLLMCIARRINNFNYSKI